MTEVENKSKEKLRKFGKFVGGQVIVLGLPFFADQIFGFAEAEYLNTYMTFFSGLDSKSFSFV